jgi:hypothetical protein
MFQRVRIIRYTNRFEKRDRRKRMQLPAIMRHRIRIRFRGMGLFIPFRQRSVAVSQAAIVRNRNTMIRYLRDGNTYSLQFM